MEIGPVIFAIFILLTSIRLSLETLSGIEKNYSAMSYKSTIYNCPNLADVIIDPKTSPRIAIFNKKMPCTIPATHSSDNSQSGLALDTFLHLIDLNRKRKL